MAFGWEDRKLLTKIHGKLDSIFDWLKQERERDMAKEQELLDRIQEETDAGTAMGMLLDKIAQDLSNLKGSLDPAAQAKIDEAITRIQANKDSWIAKTLANTPADA